MADPERNIAEFAEKALELVPDSQDERQDEENTEILATEEGGEPKAEGSDAGEEVIQAEAAPVVDEAQPAEISHDPSDVAPAETATTADQDSTPASADELIQVSDDEAKSLMFDFGDGQPVSLETLRKERMPRDHFLKKNTEMDVAKKQYESALAELQQLDNYAKTDTVGYIESVVQQGLQVGALTQEQANAFMTTIQFMENNQVYDRSVPERVLASQQAASAQAQLDAVNSEREMLHASQRFLQETGIMPNQLSEAERQGMFNYISNKRMVQPNSPVDFVEALAAVRQLGAQPSQQGQPQQYPANGGPVAQPSRAKVIEQIKRDGVSTGVRPQGSTSPVESSMDIAKGLMSVISGKGQL